MLGEAGETFLVEEALTGEEFSLFTLCRGTGRNWSGLSAAEAALTRLPIPATAQAPTCVS